MNIQGEGTKEHTYDAIVVGSGISGGWAAKELSEKGLKPSFSSVAETSNTAITRRLIWEPWEFAGRGAKDQERLPRQKKQDRTGYTTHPAGSLVRG